MADTITSLYNKYVNKVGRSLEGDRYFRYLYEMVSAGNNVIENKNQVLHKVVDEQWISIIEESLDSLNTIIEKPRRFITRKEEVVPVELAKKITADSVRHLSMNTQFIASSENGDIQPTKILNVTTEETYDLYENRFIYHLIQRLVTFIDKRTDVIFWSTGDETRNTLTMTSKVEDAYEEIEYKIDMTIKNRQSFAENDADNMTVFMRIDRIRRMVMALKNSSFCSIMQGCSKVKSPIQRTNLLMKDPDYRNCYKLWQFLERYDEVGYTIDVQDSTIEFDEEYQIQMFTNLITNYTVFKSLLEPDKRDITTILKKKNKLLTPKFVKQIREEEVETPDIPDVEIRKVYVDEVTKKQLAAEEKAAEEERLRLEAEAARDEALVRAEIAEGNASGAQMEAAAANQRAERADAERDEAVAERDEALEEKKKALEEAEAMKQEAEEKLREAEAFILKAKEEADSRIAAAEADALARITAAEENAAARITEAETTAAERIEKAETEAATRIERAETEATARATDAETKAAERAEKAEAAAEEKIKKEKEQALNLISKMEEKSAQKVRKALEDAANKIATADRAADKRAEKAEEKAAKRAEKAEADAEAKINAAKADAEKRISTAEALADARARKAEAEADARISSIKAESDAQVASLNSEISTLLSSKEAMEKSLNDEISGIRQAMSDAEARSRQQMKKLEDARDEAVDTMNYHIKQRIKAERKAEANTLGRVVANTFGLYRSEAEEAIKDGSERKNNKED
ncbi:MAG: DUF2357 domain-containing protein [Eubacteriales bacterium]|nr:DUF2357 domain-containing protein [Eubacteriales bacterium]